MSNKPGDLYKVITVAGKSFEIRYMDCGEFDPDQKGEVMPEFPFFDEHPEYTDDRYPFTNSLNDSCEHYRTEDATPDNSCYDCIYFKDAVEDIGVCRCTARRLRGVGKPLTGKLMKVAVIGKLPPPRKSSRTPISMCSLTVITALPIWLDCLPCTISLSLNPTQVKVLV